MSDPYKFLSSFGQAHLVKAISILFNHEEELLMFFFSHKERALRYPAKVLIDEASKYKLKDQILIRVAIDFWNRRGAARLADMLTAWSTEEWTRFVHAVTTLEEIEANVMDALTGN